MSQTIKKSGGYSSANFLAPTGNCFISLERVSGLIDRSRSSIYNFLCPTSKYFDPTFPRPVKNGLRAIAWNLFEVFDWMETRQRTGHLPKIDLVGSTDGSAK